MKKKQGLSLATFLPAKSPELTKVSNPSHELTTTELSMQAEPEMSVTSIPRDADLPLVIDIENAEAPSPSDILSTPVPEIIQHHEHSAELTAPEPSIPAETELSVTSIPQDSDLPSVTDIENAKTSSPSDLLSTPVPEKMQRHEHSTELTTSEPSIPASAVYCPDTSHLPSVCSNCNNLLSGKFCHCCGQKDFNYKRPLREVWRILFESWFSLDNKTLRSIKDLFFQPGMLSSVFISGKRIHYTSPLKLFLFSSFFYFFLLGITYDNRHIQINSDNECSPPATLTISPFNESASDYQASSSRIETSQPINDSEISAFGIVSKAKTSTDIKSGIEDGETTIPNHKVNNCQFTFSKYFQLIRG